MARRWLHASSSVPTGFVLSSTKPRLSYRTSQAHHHTRLRQLTPGGAEQLAAAVLDRRVDVHARLVQGRPTVSALGGDAVVAISLTLLVDTHLRGVRPGQFLIGAAHGRQSVAEEEERVHDLTDELLTLLLPHLLLVDLGPRLPRHFLVRHVIHGALVLTLIAQPILHGRFRSLVVHVTLRGVRRPPLIIVPC